LLTAGFGSPGRVTSTLRGMDAEFALKFTEEWQAAWNSHELERA
jgi:hypothetical protein